MRYINNRLLKLTEGWPDDAKAAQKAIEATDVASRKKIINRKSSVWSALKGSLANLSNDKCWYCEIRQERSDNAVDHFRPKNRVANTDPVHEGYWWLAFEHTNFRYSCTFCNSQRKNPETDQTEGKGDKFPLLPDTPRANDPGKEEDESPVLLDPCVLQDTLLLDFLTSGEPCSKYPSHPIKKLRAEESIKLYHLDHPGLIERRRILAAQIKSWIKRANRLYDRCDTGDPAIDQAFNEIACNLAVAMSETSELSAFARKVVKGSSDIVWVEELFQVA
jgi:uncharacterized protein (TIGR02646 family)